MFAARKAALGVVSRLICLIALASLCWLHADARGVFIGVKNKVTSGAPTGVPVNTVAPMIAGQPLVVQTSNNPEAWTGNTLSIANNGSWTNCSACTYTVQWYSYSGFQNGTITPLAGATAAIPGQSGAGTPANGPGYLTQYEAAVTATNSIGRGTSIPVTVTVDHQFYSTTPANTVPPLIEKCTDSTCTAFDPSATSFAVGDWVKIVNDGTYVGAPGGNGGVANTYLWIWQGSVILGENGTLTGTANVLQIPAIDAQGRSIVGGGVAAIVTEHTSVGSLNTTSNMVSSIAASGSSTPLPAPYMPAQVLTFYPAGSSAIVGAIARVNSGFSLSNSWYNWPTTINVQWYYCNDACSAPAAGQLLAGTPISGETTPNHVIGTQDVNKQLFVRMTATNSAGTTVQDTAPTATVKLPNFPALGTVADVSGSIIPSITGYAAYSTSGVGGSPFGSYLIGNYGVWTGPITSYTYQWDSCPPSNPACTTPVTGTITVDPAGGNPNLTKDALAYLTAAADKGNVINLKVCVHNILTDLPGNPASDAPCQVSLPTLPVAEFVPTPALASTPLRTYPTGQDVLQTDTCAAEPTTTSGATWYIGGAGADFPDAAHGGGNWNGYTGGAGTADGSINHPFNSLAAVFEGSTNSALGGQPGYSHPLISTILYNHGGGNPITHGVNNAVTDYDWNPASPDPTRINPGDLVIVRSPGAGSYTVPTNIDTRGLAGGLGAPVGSSPSYNVDASGATKYIVIEADSGATPVMNGASVGGRGFEFKGFWFQPATSNTILNLSGQDNIVADGWIGSYQSLSAAWSDYTTNCLNATSPACTLDFGGWVNSKEKGAVSGANAHCVAIDNNHIWFNSLVGISLLSDGHNFSDALVDSNDIAYVGDGDDVDYSGGTTIFHLNYDHDQMATVPNPPHTDAYQSQPHDNYTEIGQWGLVFDSNRTVATADANLLNIQDPHWCTANSQPTGCTHSVANPSISGQSGTGNFFTGTRVVNHFYMGHGYFGLPKGTLATGVNNSFVGDGYTVDGGAATLYAGQGVDGSYWANNVANIFNCGTAPNSTMTNNLAVPVGSLETAQAPSCGAGQATIDPTAHDSNVFVSYSPTTNGLSTSAMDFHPATGSLLAAAGVSGNGAPTLNILGATRGSPPNAGAY